ncbi:MAG: FitA-like ribbon-helix-helix domain-containing protein [Terriglobales bacterium]
MAKILVRQVPDSLKARLKERAGRHHRRLEAEVLIRLFGGLGLELVNPWEA